MRFSLATLPLLFAAITVGAPPPELLTIAESSEYRATATHAEVVELLDRIAGRSDRVHLTELGRSVEGRPIPLAIIADPPVRNAAEARASGKPIVLAFGNIHAGEVCGKEALLVLARELALDDLAPLLDDLVVLLVPIYNTDGNERFDPDNRPGQVGPEMGMGERPNAQGLDLNRDWMKLAAPETRAMVAAFTEWDPHVVIDTHTTNGSRHRYTLTYAAPLNPSGDEPSISFVRDELLPDVTERLRERTGYDTFFYGNFNRDHTTWSSYSANPRFGGPYRGLRGHMSILSEAYSYAPYRDRVLATLEFVREIMTYTAEHRQRVLELHDAARADVIARGRSPQPDDLVSVRHRLAALNDPVIVRGYALTDDGVDERTPQDHRVIHRGRFEPTVSVRRPLGYLIPPGLEEAMQVIISHGIAVEPLEGTVQAEVYTIDAIERAQRPFQGHRMARLRVTATAEQLTADDGWLLVRTAQPLGTLAVSLLEPQAADGLAAWGLLGERLVVGERFPIVRVVGW